MAPLEAKDYVYTVRIDNEVVAYPQALLNERGFIEDRIGGTPVVVIATPDLNGARAYERKAVAFSGLDAGNGELSSTDGRIWQQREEALVSDDGMRLERLPGHTSFWFAVINHATTWRLYE